mgnify:FL=1
MTFIKTLLKTKLRSSLYAFVWFGHKVHLLWECFLWMDKTFLYHQGPTINVPLACDPLHLQQTFWTFGYVDFYLMYVLIQIMLTQRVSIVCVSYCGIFASLYTKISFICIYSILLSWTKEVNHPMGYKILWEPMWCIKADALVVPSA